MMVVCCSCGRCSDEFVFLEDGYLCFDCWEKLEDDEKGDGE